MKLCAGAGLGRGNRSRGTCATGSSGLEVTRLETYYMKGPRATEYPFEGIAVKK